MEPARLLLPWDFPGKNTGVGCHFLLQGGLPDPGTEPVSPALADGFFTTEPPGKPMHTTSKHKYPHEAKTKERLCRKMGEPNIHVFTPWPLLFLHSL